MSHATDHHLHTQLCAYNSAFAELGLRFRWDVKTLRELASIDSDAARVATYIETHHPHLLTAYSCDFLCAAILERKNAMAPGTLVIEGNGAPAAEPTLADMAASLLREWTEVGVPALAGA
ncbi:MAG TPA: hypothetical protein VGG24_20185 [Paraburkholderia sp.]|jgi:hypothetical protein